MEDSMNSQQDSYRNDIKEFIINIKPSVKELIDDGDNNLIEDLELDSVELMLLLVEIENRYGINFEDEVLLIESLTTIDKLADFIKELTAIDFE